MLHHTLIAMHHRKRAWFSWGYIYQCWNTKVDHDWRFDADVASSRSNIELL